MEDARLRHVCAHSHAALTSSPGTFAHQSRAQCLEKKKPLCFCCEPRGSGPSNFPGFLGISTHRVRVPVWVSVPPCRPAKHRQLLSQPSRAFPRESLPEASWRPTPRSQPHKEGREATTDHEMCLSAGRLPATLLGLLVLRSTGHDLEPTAPGSPPFQTMRGGTQ